MDNRALLDELMGKDRDLPPEKRKPKVKFDDPKVCHYFLAAFCPHDLFPNTRSDLGPCPRLHDEKLRSDFLASGRVSYYEGELLQYLEKLLHDLERRIKRCQERLDKDIPDQGKDNSERLGQIASQLEVFLKEAEEAGEEGDVDRAKQFMDKVDALNKEKEQLVGPAASDAVASVLDKERRMQVCEVCGAMQAACDTEKRLASHYDGKQHIGYAKIRETVDELKKRRETERDQRRHKRGTDDEGPVLEEREKKENKLMENGESRQERRRQRSRSRERHEGRRRDGAHDSDRNKNGHYRDGRGRRSDDYHGGRERERYRERDYPRGR